jgi:hypothetical protein
MDNDTKYLMAVSSKKRPIIVLERTNLTPNKIMHEVCSNGHADTRQVGPEDWLFVPAAASCSYRFAVLVGFPLLGILTLKGPEVCG